MNTQPFSQIDQIMNSVVSTYPYSAFDCMIISSLLMTSDLIPTL